MQGSLKAATFLRFFARFKVANCMKSLSIVEEAPDFPAGQVGYRYLDVFESGGLLHIALLLPDDPVRALADRLRTGRRHFIRSLAKMNPTEKDIRADPARFGFDRLTMGGVLDMLDHLDTRLTGIFEAPLSA